MFGVSPLFKQHLKIKMYLSGFSCSMPPVYLVSVGVCLSSLKLPGFSWDILSALELSSFSMFSALELSGFSCGMFSASRVR